MQCFGIHAGLFFCQYLIFRVKDYISSGLHMKVTDPDGGIHSIGKKQFEGTANERDDNVVEWPKKGWPLSLEIFSYLSGGRNSEEKRQGSFKSKREGYALFKASHVLDVKFNSSNDDFCFFDARVKASMTRNKMYRTKVTQNKTGEVVSAQCTCKAGANGYCKHVGALLYVMLDFSESGLGQIPPNTTQILMIKHDYDADKRKKTE